ncbi:trichohyalin [Cystoisospora suis]|uniref:Trichohyalin n=1 Tax=Cystoisospora suis TaxID=483139 RepID=A0A2C6LD87_9APIC|nr:trichohyalin [Cystoisospora suis]
MPGTNPASSEVTSQLRDPQDPSLAAVCSRGDVTNKRAADEADLGMPGSYENQQARTWNDFVVLDEHEMERGYVVKFQRLCSRSELSMSIHERVSARLESKRRLRISRRFSFVERQRRARERHQEYLRTRRFTARKFIDRREGVIQRAQKHLEERTRNLELRASRLDKRALEHLEGMTGGLQEEAEDEEQQAGSLDAEDEVLAHKRRAEETFVNRIESLQANLQKKMQSAEERRKQIRAQEKERLAKALQQVEKEKLEEAEKRRKQLQEEESLRRKQKWEDIRESITAREQEIEEKKKSLEERVELAIERKNKIIEETKLTIQKKISEAEELVNRIRCEKEKKLQDLVEKMSQKQVKAEQIRSSNLLSKKKKSSQSPSSRTLLAEKAVSPEACTTSAEDHQQDVATSETGTLLEEETLVN